MLLIGLYLVPISIYELDFSKIPGDFGDARFNNYVLEHGYKYISGQVDSYWSAPFMYPYEKSISFSDNLLGTMPIYALFRVLDFSRETSFQLWLLVLFVLNYTCSYWVLKKWSNHNVISAVGAYIFAFSILLVGNIYNVQTMPRFIVPITFYFLWMYLKNKNLAYLLGTGICLVYQFYCGIYLGFLLFYVLLFFFISFLLIFRDKTLVSQFKDKKVLFKTLSIIGFTLIILMPLMIPYYENSKIHGLRSFDEVIGTIPTLRSYFFTSKEPILWQSLSEHGTILGAYWCHFLFLGALPWIALAISPIILFSNKFDINNKKLLQVLTLGLLLSMFFTLNFNGWTAYKLIYLLPGFSSMRSINRIINTEVVFFILIVVFVFLELSKRYKLVNKLILVLPLFVIFDNMIYPKNIMKYDKEESINKINVVKQHINEQNTTNKKNIVYLPLKNIGENPINVHLNVMLASQELGLSCVNAYTGSLPNGYIDFWNKMDNLSFQNWLNTTQTPSEDIQIINNINIKEKYRKRVSIKSLETNKFICADENTENQIVVDRDDSYDWETFDLIAINDSVFVLVSKNKLFLRVRNEDMKIISDKNFINDSLSFFKRNKRTNNYYTIQALNNNYISTNKNDPYLRVSSKQISNQELFYFMDK